MEVLLSMCIKTLMIVWYSYVVYNEVSSSCQLVLGFKLPWNICLRILWYCFVNKLRIVFYLWQTRVKKHCVARDYRTLCYVVTPWRTRIQVNTVRTCASTPFTLRFSDAIPLWIIREIVNIDITYNSDYTLYSSKPTPLSLVEMNSFICNLRIVLLQINNSYLWVSKAWICIGTLWGVSVSYVSVRAEYFMRYVILEIVGAVNFPFVALCMITWWRLKESNRV